MIRSFKDKSSEQLYTEGASKKFPPDIVKRAYLALVVLNAAPTLQTLRNIPAYNLKKRKGPDKELYSLRINKQWQVRFRWDNDDAYDVEVADTH